MWWQGRDKRAWGRRRKYESGNKLGLSELEQDNQKETGS